MTEEREQMRSDGRQKSKLILLIIFGIVFAVAGATAVQNKGAETIDLCGGSKGKIPFPHHKHQQALDDCNVCHSIFPQVSGAIEDLKERGNLGKKQVMNKQCVKCHRAKKNAGEKTGPVRCGECHQK
jgi:hypothetical protein